MADEVTGIGEGIVVLEEKLVALEERARVESQFSPHRYARGLQPRGTPALAEDEMHELFLFLGVMANMTDRLSWVISRLG